VVLVLSRFLLLLLWVVLVLYPLLLHLQLHLLLVLFLPPLPRLALLLLRLPLRLVVVLLVAVALTARRSKMSRSPLRRRRGIPLLLPARRAKHRATTESTFASTLTTSRRRSGGLKKFQKRTRCSRLRRLRC